MTAGGTMGAGMLAAVAAGGALGSVGRFLLMSRMGHWLGAGFPYGTLAVNVLGSFVLGVLIEVMAQLWSPSQELRAMLIVGLLGGFTTFSTFSLDAVYLFERHQYAALSGYVAGSVILSIAALFLGLAVMRQVLN